MARYIDADKLKEAFSTDTQHLSTFDPDLYDLIVLDIDEAPTADVKEAKRGKWIYNVKYYSCSICAGKRFNLLLGTDAEFCPYCGAKMDGRKEKQ